MAKAGNSTSSIPFLVGWRADFGAQIQWSEGEFPLHLETGIAR
jgi:hypothetical protein